jgi:surface protein
MLDEMKNDDNFTDSLWENEDGDVVVKRILRADDGTITTEFLNADGSPYTGSTSSLIPYSRDVIAVSSDYCANNVPYTVVELRDHDSKDLITRIFRNDNDFTESLTAPAGLTKGFCVEADSTISKYQPVDCDGVNVGAEVDATNVKIVNATEVFCAIVNAIDSAKDAIVDAVNQANTDITTAIENSITVLEDIKSELETANTTLTNIETNTTNINTKLDTLIGKIDVMITSLSSIDTKLTTTNELLADILVDIGNIGGDLADILTAVQSIDIKLDDVIASLSSIETKLDTLHTDLVGIQDTLNDILAELDHELIITAPTVNCATDGANKVSFYTREKIVWDSETGTQVSRAVEYSLDGEDFTASKPAGNVSIGACVLSGDITDTLVEFQVEDCDGNPVGNPMDALPTIVLNKQIVSICNVQELADAINAGAKDYTSVLESIDTKLDELTLIKAELIQSNTTLSEIETNTSETNTKLDSVIIKLDEQITLLTDLKSSFEAGNLKLDDILAKLSDILVSVDAIKVDIADIKIDIEAIKVAVESIDTKLDTVITSLTEIETKLDSVVTELQTINTTLQTEFDETQVILINIKEAIDLKGSDCANAVFTKDCDRQELLDTIEAVNTLVLDFEKTYCGTANGVNTQYLIRQFSDYNTATKVKTARPLEYSEDGLTWTETEPADTTFVLGSCPVELPEPYCIENVSYNLVGNKGMVLEANKVFEYDALVYSGGATYEEKNKVLKGEAGYSWGNGDVELMKLLPNRVLIANTSSDSDTRISVMQICGYEPIMADTIDGGLVLLASAVPNATNDAILVTFNDVPAATGYRVFRYEKGADPNTKVQLTDWTEGSANPLITDNGDGTYTYNDDTAVLGTDYMYYYEAYNSVSQGFSNTTEASLLPTTFEPVMRTTASNETVTLPMTVSSPVTIDWGDGTTTTQGAPFTKVYATPGDYHIKVNITQSREVTNFRFANAGDRLKLIDIRNWGWAKFAGGQNFRGCTNLESITAQDMPSGLTDMFWFFFGCTKLTGGLKMADWDTSAVTSMVGTFFGCSVFNNDLNWNTTNVTQMAEMFSGASVFNKSVSSFNTAKVTNMFGMFQNAFAFNQSVSNFNTSLVTNMANMFNNARVFNQSVSNFNTTNVTTMDSMFFGTNVFNQSVSNFNTSKVTSMNQMFNGALVFNQSVSNFDTSKVTTMANMFRNAKLFNQSVSNFDTSNVTTMDSMFLGASVFNQSVSNFDTAKVTNMAFMFDNALAFNQAINFSIPLVTNMSQFIRSTAMNTTNVDNMLIGFAGQTTQNNLNLGLIRPRTSASDAAKATLISRGWTSSNW